MIILLKEIKENLYRIRLTIICLVYDSCNFIKYSCTIKRRGLDYSKLRIIVISHMIEKGLSHDKIRPGFGKKNVIELIKVLDIYQKSSNPDEYIIRLGISALNQYHKMNLQYKYDDSDYINIRSVKESIKIGTKLISKSKGGKSIDDVYNFINMRSSIRIYDRKCKDIDNKDLIKCIELAQTSPSACNRQATRVYIIKDLALIKDIKEVQLGCNDFGENVSAFALITSDLSLYEVCERKLPVLDSGIFIMNLLYSLQYYGYGSCILNSSFNIKTDKYVHSILKINKNEMITGLVAIFNLDGFENIKVPLSSKRDVNDIIKFY